MSERNSQTRSKFKAQDSGAHSSPEPTSPKRTPFPEERRSLHLFPKQEDPCTFTRSKKILAPFPEARRSLHLFPKKQDPAPAPSASPELSEENLKLPANLIRGALCSIKKATWGAPRLINQVIWGAPCSIKKATWGAPRSIKKATWGAPCSIKKATWGAPYLIKKANLNKS